MASHGLSHLGTLSSRDHPEKGPGIQAVATLIPIQFYSSHCALWDPCREPSAGVPEEDAEVDVCYVSTETPLVQLTSSPGCFPALLQTPAAHISPGQTPPPRASFTQSLLPGSIGVTTAKSQTVKPL